MRTPEDPSAFGVVLFPSISHALRAEKLLQAKGIPFRLIPVPRHLSSDCGVCLRFPWEQREDVAASLRGTVDFLEIVSL